MNHKEAKKVIFQYLSGGLSKKEKEDFEAHVFYCKDCKRELEDLEEIVSAVKRIPSVPMDEKAFERTKYMVYRELKKREIPQESLSPFLFPVLIISLATFFFSNLLLWNILSKIFKDFSPFIFYTFLNYQLSGLAFFVISLIRFKGGLENEKIFL